MEKLYSLSNPKQDLRMLQCEIGPLRAIFDHFKLGEVSNYLGKEYIFYETPVTKPMPRFSRRTKDIYDELVSEHDFQYDLHTFEQSRDAWNHLYDTLDKGYLSIIYLDTYHLPFNPLYQTKHQNHCVCINGYSKSDQSVFIYDTSYKQFNKKISQKELEAAWEVYRYKKIDIHNEQYLKQVDEEAFLKAMTKNIENLTSPTFEAIYTHNTHLKKDLNPAKTYHMGFEAMEYLCDIIKNFESIASTQNLKLDLYFTIYCIAEQTDLHSLFLFNMGKKFDLPISDLADDIKYIVQEWAIVKNMLIKSSYKDTKNMLLRASNKVLGIIDKEKRYVDEMIKILS